jgi:hypothetical protein
MSNLAYIQVSVVAGSEEVGSKDKFLEVGIKNKYICDCDGLGKFPCVEVEPCPLVLGETPFS